MKETVLPEGLRFQDVESVLPGIERVSRGRSYTAFLPQGYASHTLIHLEDDEGQEYTLEVHPLLGRAEIFDERIEME